MSETNVYFTADAITLRVPSIQVSAPVDFQDRFEMRRLLNDVEGKMPKEEFERIVEMIYGGREKEKSLEHDLNELATAFEGMVRLLAYQFADKHAQELKAAMARVAELKNAGA